MKENKVLKKNTEMLDVLYMNSKGVSVAQISKTTGITLEKAEGFLNQAKELKKRSGVF